MKAPHDDDAKRIEPLLEDAIELAAPPMGDQERLAALELERLCDLIAQGHFLKSIALHLGLSSPTALMRWVNKAPERQEAVRAAREVAAHQYADKARKVLMDATTGVEVQRARELAQHYRWLSTKLAPGSFGEKVEVVNTQKTEDLSDEQLAARIQALCTRLGLPPPIAAIASRSPEPSAGPTNSKPA